MFLYGLNTTYLLRTEKENLTHRICIEELERDHVRIMYIKNKKKMLFELMHFSLFCIIDSGIKTYKCILNDRSKTAIKVIVIGFPVEHDGSVRRVSKSGSNGLRLQAPKP